MIQAPVSGSMWMFLRLLVLVGSLKTLSILRTSMKMSIPATLTLFQKMSVLCFGVQSCLKTISIIHWHGVLLTFLILIFAHGHALPSWDSFHVTILMISNDTVLIDIAFILLMVAGGENLFPSFFRWIIHYLDWSSFFFSLTASSMTVLIQSCELMSSFNRIWYLLNKLIELGKLDQQMSFESVFGCMTLISFQE